MGKIYREKCCLSTLDLDCRKSRNRFCSWSCKHCVSHSLLLSIFLFSVISFLCFWLESFTNCELGACGLSSINKLYYGSDLNSHVNYKIYACKSPAMIIPFKFTKSWWFLQGESKPFKPYTNRYHVPFIASASTSPLWYSIKRASAYIIVMSSYSAYGKNLSA